MHSPSDDDSPTAPSAAHRQAENCEGIYPLGPVEKTLLAFYEKFDGANMMTASLRVKGVVEEEPLEQALRLLQRRHPKLRSRFALDERGRPALEVLRQMPIAPVRVQDYDTDDLPWSQETLRAAREKIDSWQGPLWKLQVLRSRKHGVCELIMPHHHGIFDGRCTFRFYHDLLTYYQQIIESGGGGGISEDDVPSLPVILTSELPVTCSLPRRLLIALQVARTEVLTRRGVCTRLPASGSPHDQPHWSRLVLSQEETRAFVQRCRREQTTVGAGLFAIAAASLARTVQAARSRFSCRFWISLRELGPEPVSGDHLGCFIGRYQHVYRLRPTDSVWELARHGRDTIGRFLRHEGPALMTRWARYLHWHSRMTTRPNRQKPHRPPKRRATLEFSNIGVVDLGERYGPLVPEAFGVIIRNWLTGPSLELLSVTISGRLSIIHGANDVADDFLEDYHKSFRSLLQEAIQGREGVGSKGVMSKGVGSCE